MGKKRSFIRKVVKPTRKFVRDWGLSTAAVGLASVLAYNNNSLRKQNIDLEKKNTTYELGFAKLSKQYREAKRSGGKPEETGRLLKSLEHLL